MRAREYVKIMAIAAMAACLVNLFACQGCAELQSAPKSAEAVVDDVDDALRALTAAYNELCEADEDAGPRPALCEKAKGPLNAAIRTRNGLVAE